MDAEAKALLVRRSVKHGDRLVRLISIRAKPRGLCVGESRSGANGGSGTRTARAPRAFVREGNHFPCRDVPGDSARSRQCSNTSRRPPNARAAADVSPPVEARGAPRWKRKACDGVGRLLSALGEEKVRGAQRNQLPFQFRRRHALAEPVRLVQPGDDLGAPSIAVSACASQPCAKAWNG